MSDKEELVNHEKGFIKTYHKKLFKPFIKAITDYELVKPNDKIAVAISGGKDSLLLARLFIELKKHNKYPFELVFISMDPGFLKENRLNLESNCKALNLDVIIKDSDIFSVCEKIASDSPCYMCARMRRGFLYKMAEENGCNKLALGHHFNDVIETTLLNILYGGQFKTMVPKVKAKNFQNMELIRPMILVKEKDIKLWAHSIGLRAMDCGCKITRLKLASKRREVKELIERLKLQYKDIDSSIFMAASNVNIEAVLGHRIKTKKVSFNKIYEQSNESE